MGGLGLLMAGLLCGPVAEDAHAIAQRIGDFELALDAPWRMQPHPVQPKLCNPRLGGCAGGSRWDYGAIPIQVSIHDGYLPNGPDTALLQEAVTLHQSGKSFKDVVVSFLHDLVDTGNGRGPTTRLGRFVSLSVAEMRDGGYQVVRSYGINDAHEVERTLGVWRWAADQGSSESQAAPPPRPRHELCRRWQGQDCVPLAGLARTSEWHGTFFYRPRFGTTPGRDVRLRLQLGVQALIGTGLQRKTYTQYVSVHLGEAPLPRFDSRWVYGDLHYHSQGTDNDGESAYSYRGVLQAMGAMGLDFAFATDHASNSRQIVSVRPSPSRALVAPVFRGLRDLSPDRFAFGLEQLNGPQGANREVLSSPRSTDLFGGLAAPQLFLGAEVDVIPEFEPGRPPAYAYAEACRALPGGLKFLSEGPQLNDLGDLLALDYDAPPTVCDGGDLLDTTVDGRRLVRDVQGPSGGRLISTRFYGRQHLLHLPDDAARADAFIPSNTSRYGGATRRLKEILDLELGQRAKGFIFLAHPLARASGSGAGRLGPDLVPYSDAEYRDAFASPHFLGLQIWNENGQRRSPMNKGDARDYRGVFVPVDDLDTWTHRTQSHGLAREFGTQVWDRLLLWGLDPARTSGLDWLARGEPRRVFMAGGSDAHGDLNYRREGYLLGTDATTDTALGTPRNLVFAGPPDGAELSTAAGTARPHSQRQIVQALRDGDFAVTDGPALRIAYDSNGNGVIDDGDTPMGGVAARSNPCPFSVLVEWKSTPEFGRVAHIDLYLGVHSDALETGMIYQAWRAPLLQGVPARPEDIGGSTVWTDPGTGRRYVRTPTAPYWYDPTEKRLLIRPLADEGYEGRRSIRIDPADFPVGRAKSSCVDVAGQRRALMGPGAGGAPVRSAPLVSRTLARAPAVGRLPLSPGGGGLIGGGPDFPPPPPQCEVERAFEQAGRADRLYIRAVAENGIAPGTARTCSPFAVPPADDHRPQRIRRRAYSNPVWVTLSADPFGRLCAPEGLPVKEVRIGLPPAGSVPVPRPAVLTGRAASALRIR